MLLFVSLCMTLAAHSTPPPSTWFETLAPDLVQSILWSSGHESGTLYDWDFGGDPDAGGGIFNTGGAQVAAAVVSSPAHFGNHAASAWISNAFQAQNGNRAVRMMRWTDTHWALGGDYFPDSAYYSTWVYFPHEFNPNKYAPWDPGDGGWWNIFQFKCDDELGVSQPMMALNVDHDDSNGEMSLYLYSNYNPPHSFAQPAGDRPLPVGQWIHLEVFYKASTTNQGRFVLWQDGVKVLDLSGLQTVLPGGEEKPVWGLGNYTDHIAGGPTPGSATIYFDDCAVSTKRLSSSFASRHRARFEEHPGR